MKRLLLAIGFSIFLSQPSAIWSSGVHSLKNIRLLVSFGSPSENFGSPSENFGSL